MEVWEPQRWVWSDLTVAFQDLEELQEKWREGISREWRERTQGMASD